MEMTKSSYLTLKEMLALKVKICIEINPLSKPSCGTFFNSLREGFFI